MPVGLYKTIIYYEYWFCFICIIFSLVLFSIVTYYGKINKLRPQMKLKFAVLLTSFIFELPYFLYLLPKEFDDTPMYAMFMYWLGLLKLLSFCVVPTAIIFLVIDRILVILYPTTITMQRKLFILSVGVIIVQLGVLGCLSIILEKPIKEFTSKKCYIYSNTVEYYRQKKLLTIIHINWIFLL